jgi:L-rhamnose mutarotase
MLLLMMAACALSASGFSAYEAYVLSGRQMHVMLFAAAKEGREAELRAQLRELCGRQAEAEFLRANISNVSAHGKTLQGKACLLLYFDFDGTNYLDAVRAFEALPQAARLKPLVQPHPRAAQQGTAWLQLEWINYIQGARPSPAPKRFAMVTRVKPEKEAEYRLLHQSTWPAVVDRMTRMGYHDFSIFLVELGDELYEMFYAECTRADGGKDEMGSLADPAYERWIRQTDPCQLPLPDAEGTWSAMEKYE